MHTGLKPAHIGYVALRDLIDEQWKQQRQTLSLHCYSVRALKTFK